MYLFSLFIIEPHNVDIEARLDKMEVNLAYTLNRLQIFNTEDITFATPESSPVPTSRSHTKAVRFSSCTKLEDGGSRYRVKKRGGQRKKVRRMMASDLFGARDTLR
jgi:hypothetical protein